jgi:hypothetical protein
MFKSTSSRSKGLFGFSFMTIGIAVGVLAYSMRWFEKETWYPTALTKSTFLKFKDAE